MKLYIETENGQTKNHPAIEENLLMAFGTIPDNWEPFTRVERPVHGVYQMFISETPVYRKVNGIWTDVWLDRDMTAEEITAKQQAVITAFNAQPQASNWSTWILDEATCTMVPPIPRPNDDPVKLAARIFTFWCGADNDWKDTPARPVGNYKFDYITWEWVEETTS